MAPPETLEGVVNGTPSSELSPGVKEREPSVTKGGKNLNIFARTSGLPTQAYEDAKEVPAEFLNKDPRAVPNRIWGQSDDDASGQNYSIASPLVDMSPLINQGAESEGGKKVIAEIGKACEGWGYFQAVNHGIPESLLERLLEVGGEFFSLPLEEKNVYAASDDNEGYGRQSGRPCRYWSDMMRHTVRPQLTPEEVEKRLPAKPAEYRALIEEYTQAVEKLLQVVFSSLSVHLGLQPSALQKQQDDGAQLVLRMNYYPKCPEPEKVLGLGVHEDFGSLTVLLMDQVGGLQVRKPGGDKPMGDNVWFDVKPIKGTLLISVGIIVEHLSNGRLNGMWHRTVVNRNEPRLSIAAFAFPGPNCIISPMQELLEKSQEAPRFRQHRFGDFYRNVAIDLVAGIAPWDRFDITAT